MPALKLPTQADVESYFKRLNNWGRWGADDQRCTVEWDVRAGRVSDVPATANRRLRKTSPFAERVPQREVIWLEPRIVAELSAMT